MIILLNWPEWRTLLFGYVKARNVRLEDGKPRPFLVFHVLRKVETAVTWLVIVGAQPSLYRVIGATRAIRWWRRISNTNDCEYLRQVAPPKYSIIRNVVIYRPIVTIILPNWPEWRGLWPVRVESQNVGLEDGKPWQFLVWLVLKVRRYLYPRARSDEGYIMAMSNSEW